MDKKIDDAVVVLNQKEADNKADLRNIEVELHNDLQVTIDTSIKARQKNARRAFAEMEARIDQLTLLTSGGAAKNSMGFFNNIFHSITELALLGLGTIVSGVTGLVVGIVKMVGVRGFLVATCLKLTWDNAGPESGCEAMTIPSLMK